MDCYKFFINVQVLYLYFLFFNGYLTAAKKSVSSLMAVFMVPTHKWKIRLSDGK
jgi:hypothetical protein